MNRIFLFFFPAVLAGTFFTSCKDDDDWSNVAVPDSELKTILKEKGYTFNEEGNLVLNDLALNTLSLDLSGTKISESILGGLDVLPHLTEVDLSDNGYGPAFDFSALPSAITGVDLTGNEIYEYTGLVDVKVTENDEENVTVLRNMTKLDLPMTAKYDTHELVYFYEQNKDGIEAGTVDLEMADSFGSLSAYTTLRDIPDENCRAVLKESFPSLFDGDQVNLANRITDLSEAENYVDIYTSSEIENAEGIQYIFEHRAYAGGIINIQVPNKTTIPFFKIYTKGIGRVTLLNINTPNGIDFGNSASDIYAVTIANNDSITSLDLSQSEKIGQRSANLEMLGSYTSKLHVECCPLLEDLDLLPEKATIVHSVELHNLPKLKKIDLSQLEAIMYIRLSQLGDCDITYPAPAKWRLYRDNDNLLGDYSDERAYMSLGITEDVYERQVSKDFLNTYSSRLRNPGIYSLNGYVAYFDWTDYYDCWTRP